MAFDRNLEFADQIDAREAELLEEFAPAVEWAKKLRALIKEAQALETAGAKLPNVWGTPETWGNIALGLQDTMSNTGLEALDVVAMNEVVS